MPTSTAMLRSGQLWIEMRSECGQDLAGAFLRTLARAITTFAEGPVTPNPAIPADLDVCEYINTAVPAIGAQGPISPGRGIRGRRLLQDSWLGSDDRTFAAFGNLVLSHGDAVARQSTERRSRRRSLNSHSGADTRGWSRNLVSIQASPVYETEVAAGPCAKLG